MVRVLGLTEYKVVARLIRATESGLPSDRHPNRIECAAVLGAVKAGLARARVRGKVGAPTNLDSLLRAPALQYCGSGEETVISRSNKETDEESKKKKSF
jgi:hypothetical protein